MNDLVLRKELVELLKGGQAHVTIEMALVRLDPRLRNVRPKGGPHSVWEVLEHLRIAQNDILRYTLDASWVSPQWPNGYWPADPQSFSDETWSATVSGFSADFERVITLIQDPAVDLTAEIPHGEGRTYLREILLVADHNAYHIGQIVQIRKALGNWPE